jgi:hypothetical protein
MNNICCTSVAGARLPLTFTYMETDDINRVGLWERLFSEFGYAEEMKITLSK